jgi:hypothetical protein
MKMILATCLCYNSIGHAKKYITLQYILPSILQEVCKTALIQLSNFLSNTSYAFALPVIKIDA